MITLNGRQTIGAVDVFRDDSNRLAYYVQAHHPKMARDENGKAILSLLSYRRPPGSLTEEERKTQLGGGILTLSAELSVSDEEMAAIRSKLAAQPRLRRLLERKFDGDEKKLADALRISSVPVKSGTVTIAIAGESEGATGEFVANLVGVGKVSMMGAQRASFMAKLTQDGATLLWEAMERDLAIIRVAYDLVFEHRLDAVRMVVWANAKKSYEAIQEQWQELHDSAHFSDKTSDNTRRLTAGRDQSSDAGEKMRIASEASQNSGVTITPETTIDPEVEQELVASGNRMIQEFFASTFLTWTPGAGFTPDEQPTLETELAEFDGGRKYGRHDISHYSLKDWSEEMTANLYHNFKSKAVVEGTLAPNDNLSNILGEDSAEEYRLRIDLDDDYFKYLDVQVMCTADFEEDPVDLVKAHLAYKQSGPNGTIDEVADFAFGKDSAPQNFLAFLAAPDKKSYDYEYEIFYSGSDKTFKTAGTSDETILVLDTDRLGILRVDCEVGLVDWEQIRAVEVRLSYDEVETQFTLSAAEPSHRWSAVIGKQIEHPYDYQLTFIDKDNQRIELEVQRSRSPRLIIDQPIAQSLEVAVVAAGTFDAEGLARIAVALRYSDEANSYSASETFMLTGTESSVEWNVPLVNPDHREYEYQTTVFYSDGVIREEEWKKTDQAVLPVGDPYGFRVQVSPYLLANPPYAFGNVHLSFTDAEAEIAAETTLEITNFTEPLFWRFRLGDPQRHEYKYQLTLFTTEGEELALPETAASREVLVLKPPPAN